MPEAAQPLLRFALYADLLLLAGLTGWMAFGPGWARDLFGKTIPSRLASWLAGAGLVLAIVAMLASIGAMMGQAPWQVDRGIVTAIVLDTATGHGFLARAVALVGVLLAAMFLTVDSVRSWLVAILAAVALGSLAWSGHAVASEGLFGTVHRFNDALHLLAAAAWIGAIAGFAVATWVRWRGREGTDPALLADALHRFGRIGTVLVLVIALSGVANLALVAGWAALIEVWRSPYGVLLLAKLAGFGAMLALAGLNRWRFGPRLAAAAAKGQSIGQAMQRLRASLVAELVLAGLVIVLVAQLGLTSP